MAATQNPHGHNHGMDSARAKVEQMKKQWAQKKNGSRYFSFCWYQDWSL